VKIDFSLIRISKQKDPYANHNGENRETTKMITTT